MFLYFPIFSYMFHNILPYFLIFSPENITHPSGVHGDCIAPPSSGDASLKPMDSARSNSLRPWCVDLKGPWARYMGNTTCVCVYNMYIYIYNEILYVLIQIIKYTIYI